MYMYVCVNGWASLVAQMVKNLPAMWETWDWSLGRKALLEKRMATTPAFLPGEFHGQKSLPGYNPWDHRESDITEWVTPSLSALLWDRVNILTYRSHSKSHPLDVNYICIDKNLPLTTPFFVFIANIFTWVLKNKKRWYLFWGNYIFDVMKYIHWK